MPVGAARFTVGIQLGGLGEWVQVEDAVFHDVEVFGKPGKKGPTVPAQLIHEGMEETAPGLFRCSGNALTLAPPPTGTGDQAMLLALVFRPVVWRSEAREMRSEEHTSELQSLMRISYAVFCLKKKNNRQQNHD